MQRKKYILFGIFFLIPVLIAGFLYLPYQILITRTGEHAPAPLIAKTLAQGQNCVYARATVMGTPVESFKHLQYELLKPDIAIVGSSRSMQFKSDYFSQPSFTFGGTVSNIYDFEDVIYGALKKHPPKAMILQLDYWWFSPRYFNGIFKKKIELYKYFRNHVKLAYEPYMWILDGKLDRQQFLETVLSRTKDSCHMGIMGALQHKGYTRDGSYFYGTDYILPHEEQGFSKEINAIDKETFRIAGIPDAIDEARLQIFADVIQEISRLNIPYVVIFPPFAPDVYDHLKEKNPDFLKFMDSVVKNVRELADNVYDFHDPATIQTHNCDFLDGDHGGLASYIKILNALENSAITPYLNHRRIQQDMKRLDGKAISPEELQRFMPGKREIDFLNLGCQK